MNFSGEAPPCWNRDHDPPPSYAMQTIDKASVVVVERELTMECYETFNARVKRLSSSLYAKTKTKLFGILQSIWFKRVLKFIAAFNTFQIIAFFTVSALLVTTRIGPGDEELVMRNVPDDYVDYRDLSSGIML